MSLNTISGVRRMLQVEKQLGYLGALDAAGKEMIRDDATGDFWVRPVMSTGSVGTGVKLPLAPNASVPEVYNLGVDLAPDPSTRQLQIIGVDMETMKQQGLDPSLVNPAQGKNILLEQILNLSAQKHPTKTWYAYVYPGVIIINGTVVDWLGGEINLSGQQPSSGNHCYTGVYITNAAALGLISSTPQSISTPLDVSDLQEIKNGLPANSAPLRAFTLTGSDAGLIDTLPRTRDLRSPFVWF